MISLANFSAFLSIQFCISFFINKSMELFVISFFSFQFLNFEFFQDLVYFHFDFFNDSFLEEISSVT